MAANAPRHPQSDALRDRLLSLLRDAYRGLEREQLYRAAETAMRYGRTGGTPPERLVPPFADAEALLRGFEAEFVHALAAVRPAFSPEQVNLLVGDLVQQFEVIRRSEVSRSSARLAAMTGSQSTTAAASGAGRSVLDDQRGPSLRTTPDRLRRDTSSGSIPALPSPTEPRAGSLSGSFAVSPTPARPAQPTQQTPTVQGMPSVRQSMPSASMPAIVQGTPSVRQSMSSGSMPAVGGATVRAPLRPPTRPLTGLPPRPTIPTPGLHPIPPATVQPAAVDAAGITEGLGAVVLYDDKAGAIEVLPMSQQAEGRVRTALAPGRQLRLVLNPAPPPGRDLEIRVEVPWQSRPFIVLAKAGPSSPRGTLLEVSRLSGAEGASVAGLQGRERAATAAPATPASNGRATAAIRTASFDPKRARPAAGSLLHRGDGAVGDAGAVGTLMRQAAVYPGVVLEVDAGAEQWRVTTLEDLLLDVEVAPMRLEFTLEALVTKSGLADQTKLQAAIAQHHQTGEPLETLLTTTGALRFRELDAILATRLRMLFAAFASAHATHFKVEGYDRIDPLAAGQPISFATLAFGRLHDALEKMQPGELEEWGRATAGFPKTRRDLRIPLQRFGIGARELAFLETEANGSTSVGALLSKSPIRRHSTLALLATLDRMGYLEWVRHDVAELRAMRAKPLIEQKASELQQANLFGILDTHWSDYDAVIPAAAKKVIEGLDLPYLTENGPAEMQQTARRLAMGLRAVADRLSTRSQREAVRAKLVDDFARSGAVDLYEKQADMALFKSDWEHAEDQLRRILELEPGNRKAAKRLEEVIETRKSISGS